MINIAEYIINITCMMLCFLFVAIFAYVPNSNAQDVVIGVPSGDILAGEVDDDGVAANIKVELGAISKQTDSKPANKVQSLFFTYWQHIAIIDAKNSRGSVRPPTQSELDRIVNGEEGVRDPGLREVTLGGVLFKGKNNWTIWLNGQRVKPDSVPKEVLDLHVYNDYVEFKWLDEYTNQIFPIRLKAHERFNIDSRIFLPN